MGTIAVAIIFLLREGDQGLEMMSYRQTQICLIQKDMLLTTKLYCVPYFTCKCISSKFSFVFFVPLLMSSGYYLYRIKKIFFGYISKNMCFFCLLVPKVNILKLTGPYNNFTPI